MRNKGCDLGLVGLGAMGRNLVLNMADHDFAVAVYNRTSQKTKEFMEQEVGGRDIRAGYTPVEFVGHLQQPRAVIIMAAAGEPVDAVIDELLPLLTPGDLLIDGGNSYFKDTDRRGRALAAKGLLYLGLGISGGEQGARHGPSLMPGGPREAYDRVRPILNTVAAKVQGEPCVAYLGGGAAGHYVKMVHNGIEYAVMELLAESYDLLRRGLGLNPGEVAGIFEEWNRGHYYDAAGALRDMIQNHLLQILCLIAMEPPISFNADEVRNKKVDVLKAVRPILPEQVQHFAVRGQYGAGWIEGQHIPGYRAESNVAPDSATGTYAAVKLLVDNWRWQGVPFYLRTGKRLQARISEVSIQFRPVPHHTFPATAVLDWRPNRLIIAIQPEEGILLCFEAKYPGPAMRLSPVIMQFYYREAFRTIPPEAYETLLLDVVRGDATLFMRADQGEAAWAVLTPVPETWGAIRPTDFPHYQAGTWGPEAADILIARDGRNWVVPTFLQCQEDIAVCRVTMAPSS